MNIVIVNSNLVHQSLEDKLVEKYNAVIINRKEDLTVKRLSELEPDYIFFPHWSYIIPKPIFDKFECIVFHMTDLPYGRGGSPLQNLIVRGHQATKVSALRVVSEIDAGDIYLKKDLSLLGTGEEVFLRVSKIIEQMIAQIIDNQLKPYPQIGEVKEFKRRTPDQSNIENLLELEQLFDYIRMLDAEGYPNAFLETDHFKLEFSRVSLKKDSLIADVRIFKR